MIWGAMYMGVPTDVWAVGLCLVYSSAAILAKPKSDNFMTPFSWQKYLNRWWGCSRSSDLCGICSCRRDNRILWQVGGAKARLFVRGCVRTFWDNSKDYWIRHILPSWAVLEKEVDVVLSLWEIDEINDVWMLDSLPGLDLVFESIDKILFGEWFVLSLVDFFDEIFLFDHFAGDYFIWFGVDGQVGFGKTAHPQHFVLDWVPAVHYFQRVSLLHSLVL